MKNTLGLSYCFTVMKYIIQPVSFIFATHAVATKLGVNPVPFVMVFLLYFFVEFIFDLMKFKVNTGGNGEE